MKTKHMLSGIIALIGAAVILVGMSGAAVGQDILSKDGTILYGGLAADQAGITLGNWGGGVCKESSKTSRLNSYSIEITPKSLYEGGRIDFKNAVDVTSTFNDPNTYLQILSRFGNVTAAPKTNPWDAMFGGPPGYSSGDTSSATTAARVKRIRAMVVLDTGQSMESQVDLSAFKPLDDGWMGISFPLSVLKGNLNLPAYKIKRVVIAGDGTEQFYVGEIRIIKDITPIEADAGGDQDVARNDRVRFTGSCNAGAAAVKFSWDFDQSDGIMEEAVGNIVSHKFRKAGDFVVTLTCSDIFGVKKPATSTLKVHVNE